MTKLKLNSGSNFDLLRGIGKGIQMARPKVILFDVNETLLDLTPVKERVGKALGGRPELVQLWFTTLLQYSLATTVADKNFDFAEIGAACPRGFLSHWWKRRFTHDRNYIVGLFG